MLLLVDPKSPEALSVASVAKLLKQPPPGSDTQTAAQAAVALVLLPRPTDVVTLLIRRAQRRRDPWSGHVALPGGRRDETDPNLLSTAKREAYEEVGVDLSRGATFVGVLDSVNAVARGRPIKMSIHPYVFWLDEDPVLTLNDEVQEAFWVGLKQLKSGALNTRHAYETAGQRVWLPAFNVDGRIVWGLTHRILTSLIERLPNED